MGIYCAQGTTRGLGGWKWDRGFGLGKGEKLKMLF